MLEIDCCAFCTLLIFLLNLLGKCSTVEVKAESTLPSACNKVSDGRQLTEVHGIEAADGAKVLPKT